MKRHFYALLPIAWFIGLGVIPTLVVGHLSSFAAAIVSYAWFALIIPMILFMMKGTPKHDTVAFALFWIIGAWATWIPLAILTDRITYSFYYLTTVPVLCLGAGMLVNRALSFAEKSHNRDFHGFTKGAVAIFLFFHLVVFCLLVPNNLYISIPASILVLAFALDYLGYRYQTMFSAVIAISLGILGLRFILYGFLEKWFGTETIIGLYPANIWFWIVGMIITTLVIVLIFAVLRRWILRPSAVALPPPAV